MAANEPKNKLTEKPVLVETAGIAASDVERFYFAGVQGAVLGAGLKSLGVINRDTAQGEAVPVMVEGIAIVRAGAAVAAGAEVESDAQGRAITQASGKVNGLALTAATQAGDLIRIVLK